MAARPLSAEEHDALQSGLNLAAAMAGVARPLDAARVQELYDGFELGFAEGEHVEIETLARRTASEVTKLIEAGGCAPR